MRSIKLARWYPTQVKCRTLVRNPTEIIAKLTYLETPYRIDQIKLTGSELFFIGSPKSELEKVPPWFYSEMPLRADTTIVIVDDDVAIHHLWEKRFDYFRQQNVFANTIISFSSPDELNRWLDVAKPDFENTIFLIDYEFLETKTTGLDLIKARNLQKNAILVTSRNDDILLASECEAIKLRMLPKAMAMHVPIAANSVSKYDAVLIDDDALVRLTWETAARAAHKKIKTFITVEHFLEFSHSIDLTTNIYIDSDLKNEERGEISAKRIKEIGFIKIFLATGFQSSDFADLPHIDDIVTKDPPWVK